MTPTKFVVPIRVFNTDAKRTLIGLAIRRAHEMLRDVMEKQDPYRDAHLRYIAHHVDVTSAPDDGKGEPYLVTVTFRRLVETDPEYWTR